MWEKERVRRGVRGGERGGGVDFSGEKKGYD